MIDANEIRKNSIFFLAYFMTKATEHIFPAFSHIFPAYFSNPIKSICWDAVCWDDVKYF